MPSIFATGGKQYLVSVGEKLQVEKLDAEVGTTLTFDKVLLTTDGTTAQFGTPLLAGGAVQAKVLAQGRGRKIRVLKYKAKSKYRRNQGHRQAFTELEITKA